MLVTILAIITTVILGIIISPDDADLGVPASKDWHVTEGKGNHSIALPSTSYEKAKLVLVGDSLTDVAIKTGTPAVNYYYNTDFAIIRAEDLYNDRTYIEIAFRYGTDSIITDISFKILPYPSTYYRR